MQQPAIAAPHTAAPVRRQKLDLLPYVMIAPALLAIGLFSLLPTFYGMLISVFELLADARQQVAAVNATIGALRDFWVAEASLQLALTGKSPGTMNLAGGADAMPAGAAAH